MEFVGRDTVRELRVGEQAGKVGRTGLEEDEGDARYAQLSRGFSCGSPSPFIYRQRTARMSTNATGRDGL